MDDLISRQAAIDALGDMVMNWTDSDYELGQLNQWKEDRKAIIDLPSVQPEIVRCVDCIHSDTFHKGADNDMPLKCLDIRYGGVMPDWYCEHAERKEDE